VERTGALLVAWTDEERATLPALRDKALANGYDRCAVVGPDDVYAAVPALGPGARGGLTVPDEALTCGWSVNLALATDAVTRGAHLLLGRRVEGATVGEARTALATGPGAVEAKWVVNAAGLGADVVDRMFGYDRFHVTPRRGEVLVYDKFARSLLDRIVLPVPSSRGKGVLISPTIYGNVMIGPTAEDIEDRSDTATSGSGFDDLLWRGTRMMPALLEEEVIAAYAGLRAASEHSDYLIEADASQRYVLVGSIPSTGLSAAMAIARHVVGLLGDAGLPLDRRPTLPDPAPVANLAEAFPRPFQQPDRIAADPEYGRVVCFCERVTAGEIRDARASVIPPATLDGLQRRTRAMNGRCQGTYCGPAVARLFEAVPT
jgi:glycerol-3-phosphate dehydrogenase